MIPGNNTVVGFKEVEIFKIENVLFELRQMIPDTKDNKEILKKVIEAENSISKGIESQQKDNKKNLKGASTGSIFSFTFPEVEIITDKNYGIKNLCKKFGLVK